MTVGEEGTREIVIRLQRLSQGVVVSEGVHTKTLPSYLACPKKLAFVLMIFCSGVMVYVPFVKRVLFPTV